ncbi:MAG: hypothetical protein FD176_891 [Rhodospirillaceae bacterium]|nr:MAG: hypothetical protein FD176_891 [Rhodospirillaceae bacterium]TNC97844.1 MAG: hypothetical protein FD119_832 [Stygiobacter sp.]
MGRTELTGDAVTIRFRDDSIATACVRGGDVQLACLAQAAQAQNVPLRLFRQPSADGQKLNLNLHLHFPHGEAYCRWGRIATAPPGVPFEESTHVNGPFPQLIADKHATKLVLDTMGFPTPVGNHFTPAEHDQAVAFFHACGGHVCVKSNTGSLGEFVFPDITTADDFIRAFQAVASFTPQILVERHVSFPPLSGNASTLTTYRFFFVKPSVVGIRMDVPPNVVGDGRSSLGRLIAGKNVEKKMRTGQAPIEVNALLKQNLHQQGYDLDTIPGAGEQVFLKKISNSSQWGDSITLVDNIHSSYKEKIESMCNTLSGVNITAIDMKIADVTQPACNENYSILEMNSSPGMVYFHFPWIGPENRIAGHIVEKLRTTPDWFRRRRRA